MSETPAETRDSSSMKTPNASEPQPPRALGIAHAHQVVLDQELVDVLGPLVGLVDLGRPRRDAFVGDRSDERAEFLELLGQLEALEIGHQMRRITSASPCPRRRRSSRRRGRRRGAASRWRA